MCIRDSLAYVAATWLKYQFKYDDALDVVGVHGVGGLVGIIMLSFFASTALGGTVVDLDIPSQLKVQAFAALFAIVYTSIISFVILKFLDVFIGLRVTEEDEVQGLDYSDHGESGYDL